MSHFFAAALSEMIVRFLPGIMSYVGAKSFSISTFIPFEGRSRTCPIEARTSKPGPRYLLIVFDFAGDSTITNAFFAAAAFAIGIALLSTYARFC